MTWLLESPWPAIVVGALAEIALICIFFATGRVKLLIGMAAVAVLAGGMFLLQWWVVTDREQIRQNVFDAAKAVEQGDVDGVIKFISPSAKAVQDRARQVSAMRLREVRVADDLKIDVRDDVEPKQARVSGICSVGVTGMMSGVVPVNVTLFMRKDGDHWLIYDAEHRVGLR